MTPNELRNAVVAKLRSEIGYTSGNYNWSKYGQAKNWRSKWLNGVTEWQGMYCNRFISWGTDQVMGAKAAKAAMGRQSYTSLPAGFAATWLQRDWHRANGRHVGFANSQPGDHFLFKLPGRQTNPTNHIGTFVRWHVPGKIAVVVEGNLARPGYGSSTIGVWEHYRDITYVVGVYRPDWKAAAAIYNAENVGEGIEDLTKVHRLLTELGYPASKQGIRQYQQDNTGAPHRLVVDGIAGVKTIKALEEDMAKIDDVIDLINTLRSERTNAHVKESEKQDRILANQNRILNAIADARNGINVVGRVAREAREAAKEVPARIVGFRVPFQKGTSAHDTFGDNFRLGALLGYAAQGFYRRGEQTDEIVERLEDQMGKVEPVIGPGEVHNETE